MGRYSVPLFDLNFDQAEEDSVTETVRSRWISMGQRAAALEDRFAAHLGSKHAVALNSCTAALHLSLLTTVEPGDEVIVPSYTFVATANAVRYVGAVPVFADIVDTEDFSIDPASVRAKITPRTRAIIPMHYAGFPCDMAALGEIAREHDLAIIEDAAHAPDTVYQGKRLGTFGRTGCFSFFSNKNITCAEGGMLVTDDDEVARRSRLFRSHGMTSVSYDRAKGHAVSYDVVELGFNYRLDDIRAGLLLTQMDKLTRDTEMRAVLRDHYVANLSSIPEVFVPYRSYGESSSNYILPVVLREGGAERRDLLRHQLADRGIETSVHYPAAHRFSIYSEFTSSLPRTEFVTDHEVTLPLFAHMQPAQVDEVTEALRDSLKASA